jgi:K+-sensing histidine kinase KdpD
MNLKDLKDYTHNVILTDRVSKKARLCLALSLSILTLFFLIESLIVFNYFKPSYLLSLLGYVCMLLFVPPFMIFIKAFLDKVNSNETILLEKVIEKNTYLEHAAKILRHDMHSGLNTYIPRGIRSLERRLNADLIKELNLESTMRLLKEGLAHSQHVYKGVFEFTNLVREDSKLCLELIDLGDALECYLKRTNYSDQVLISEDMPTIEINESLFCTAIDNLIRNGLKYNDSDTKWVKIDMIDNNRMTIIDNGRGMSSKEFEKLRLPYTRRENQKEIGSGLGLNICVAILNEHGFKVSAKKLEQGTMITVEFK